MNRVRKTIWVLGMSVLFLLAMSANNKAAALENHSLNGTILVVNKRADSVSIIDIGNRKIVAEIATQAGPHELVMSQDGTKAVVTNYVGGNSLTVIDVLALRVARTIDLKNFPKPHGIVMLENQKHVAVSSEGSDTVVIADINTGNIVNHIDTHQKGSHMVAQSSDSRWFYTTNMFDDSVTVIDASTNKMTVIVPAPKRPEAIAVNNDGAELWIGGNKEGVITIFDTDKYTPIAQLTGYVWPYRILLNYAQTIAAIPDYKQNTLDIIDTASKTRTRRIELPNRPSPKGVVFHPNDRTLFLSLYDANKVQVIDTKTGDILFDLLTGDGPDGIGYSHLITTTGD